MASLPNLLSPREEIHEAAREGRYARVEQLLLDNPKLAQKLDADERLPLHWAVTANQRGIVELLHAHTQPRFDPDAPDGSGWTPLMMAASLRDGEALVGLLLAYGATVDAKNNANRTALHYAVSQQRVDTARLLLGAPHRASPRVRDCRQQLALHRAAAVGSVPLITLLADAGSPLNATDVDGMTPLHHAIAEGWGDAAVALLRRGANSGTADKEDRLAIELAPDRKVYTWIVSTAHEDGLALVLPERDRAEAGRAE